MRTHLRAAGRRAIALLAAATAAGLALTAPTTTAAATAAPWWCAPGAELNAGELPAFLPATDCDLAGRTIRGEQVDLVVPPAGMGTTASTEDLVLWTDAAGVHLTGDHLSAAIGYADELTGRLAAGGPVHNDFAAASQARAIGDVVRTWAATHRTAAPAQHELLDAADLLLVTFEAGTADAAPATSAAAMLASYLRTLATPSELDGAPTLQDLVARARAVRDGTVEGDVALTDTLALVSYLTGRVDETAGGALAALSEYAGQLQAAARLGESGQPPHDALMAAEQFLLDQAPVVEPIPGPPDAGTLPDLVDVGGTGSPPPCKDNYRTDGGYKRARGSTVGWYYNNRNAPGYYAEADWRAALGRGFGHMTGLHDDCGYSWHPDIYHAYRGTTTVTGFAGNSSKASCATPDPYNVVAWADFNSVELAYTCTATDSRKRVLSADIVYNGAYGWDIPEVNGRYNYAACSGGYWDLENVSTHEFGHVLGIIKHAPEANHGNLTMSEMADPCDRRERTPGLGDALSLSALYGRV